MQLALRRSSWESRGLASSEIRTCLWAERSWEVVSHWTGVSHAHKWLS